MAKANREDFVRLANRRVPAAIKAIELVGNLSNRLTYVYEDRDVKAVVKALKTAVAECEARFAGTETRVGAFELGE